MFVIYLTFNCLFVLFKTLLTYLAFAVRFLQNRSDIKSKNMSTLVRSLSLVGLLWTGIATAQDAFNREFESIRQDLVSWDPVRGEWLANSLVAMSNNQPVPDRMFPENFTPSEMYSMLPSETRTRVRNTIQQQARNADSTSVRRWNEVNRFASRPGCNAVMGRSYGDPHLQSFDGAAYSFQTVGEFTLVKSQSGHMNVQVRQRAEGQDFSLNSAVAMWVAGDRVCLYANDRPDGNTTTPLRIEGQAIYVEDRPFFLDHGGVIRREREDYIITWPTGERVKVDIRGWNTTGFMNIAVEIFPCTDTYFGILGNANGRSNDDFQTGPNGRNADINVGIFGSNDPASQTVEREYLNFLARDFAQTWRITQPESLFDYGWGQSTQTFTDLTFPRTHRTLGDMNDRDRDRARRECERQGLRGAELNACIFDGGFLRIPPTPRPVINDPTTGTVIRPTRPTPNVNPGRPVRERAPGERPSDHVPGTADPMIGQPGTNNPDVDTRKPERPLNPVTREPATDPGVKEPGTAPTPKDPAVRQPNPVTQPTTKEPASSEPTKPVYGPPPVEEDKPRRPIFTSPTSKPTSTPTRGNGGSNGTSQPAPRPSTPSPAPRPSTPRPSAPSPAPRPSTPKPSTNSPKPMSTPKIGRP